MDLKKLDRGEAVATVGGIILALSLFLTWYTLGNSLTVLNSCRGPNGSCSGWASLTTLRYLLLLAAVAPVILAYIIVRGHALSWPRGELTAVTATCGANLHHLPRCDRQARLSARPDLGRIRVVRGVARRPPDPDRLDLARS